MSYCPYCNAGGRLQMTDEHVIPKAIGGDSRTVIQVCRRCNNTIGRNIDKQLSSHGWLRLNAVFANGLANRHDRLPATTTLKDGRALEGHCFFIQTRDGVVPGFEPKKHQPDGTVWLSENAITDYDSLPPHINVFRRDLVEYWGFDCPPPRLGGMEPAMIKILLGIVYIDQGEPVVSSPSFDILRSSLTGVVHPEVLYTWLDQPMRWDDSTIKNHEHAVYFECVDQELFRGGVALFGTAITFEIRQFGKFLPRRRVRWPGRAGPPAAARPTDV